MSASRARAQRENPTTFRFGNRTTRRRFLARMGLASPLLLGVGNTLIGRALGQTVRRRLFFVFAHGEAAPYGSEYGFTPVGIAHGSTPEDRSGVEFPSMLAKLAPFRQNMVILDGLQLKASNQNLIHGWKRGLLAGTGTCESPTHQTIDQYLAGALSKTTPIKSLLFGGGGSGWAATGTQTFVAGAGMDARHVGDPAVFLNQLVGNVGAATSGGASPLLYRSKLLDAVREDVRRLERGLAGEEKAALAAYLAAMEGFQKQEEGLVKSASSCGLPASVSSGGDNTTRLTAMFRIATLALRCGVTNVVGATIGNTGIHEDMRGFGGPWGPYEGHPPRTTSPVPYALWMHQFSQYSLGLVAEMITALGPLASDLVAAVVPAGGLANNEGTQHHGTRRGVAYVYDGTGQLKTGARYYRQPRDMADLYTTFASVLGAPVDKFNGVGAGVIKELLV